MKSIKVNNDIQTQKSPIVRVALVIGTREDIDSVIDAPIITIYRKHFTPRLGWELKDCVIVGLPQRYRFLVLKDVEHKEREEAGYYVLFCSRY